MSSLIWTLTLLTLACSGKATPIPMNAGLCEIPAPVNLSLSSRNFVHILTWEPGPGSPKRLSYRVEVYSLGDATWLDVPGCEEVVSPQVCNLTEALPDPSESYFIGVWANQGDLSSAPAKLEAFIPKDHTYLDPPLLSVSVCGNNLCVGLWPPPGQRRHVYSSLGYVLTVNNSKDGAQFNLSTNGLVGVKIKDLEPGRKYCVTATIVNRKSASSQPQCIETAVLSSPDREISIALCAIVIVVFAGLFFLAYTEFICMRTSIPQALISLESQDVYLLPSTYDKIANSLLHEDTTTTPPVAGGWKHESWRNSTYEEDEDSISVGTGGAGYESRRGRAVEISRSGGSSSACPVIADGHFLQSKLADNRNVSQTSTDCQDVSGSATDSEPLLLSLTGKGPLTESTTVHSGPLSLTGEGPLFVPVASDDLQALSFTTIGLRPASLDEGRAAAAIEKAGGSSPSSLRAEWEQAGAEGQPAAELLWALQAGGEESRLNVNLASVMLAGQEEKEEEDEGEMEEKEEGNRHWPDGAYERRPVLFGVSPVPLPVLPLPAVAAEHPCIQLCSAYSEEEEEDEDDDNDNEEYSGYLRCRN